MSSAVDAFGGSFFAWFQDEVLPYMLGSLYVIIMFAGFILNGVLITTIRKKNMLEVRTNRMILELAITDLIACVLFIFPAIVVAFWRKWELSDYFCKFHGTIFTACYLISFGLMILLAVERVVRAKNFDLHDRVFLRSNGIRYFSLLIWFISMGIACIPLSGWVKISYDFYQAACVPEFGNNVIYICIVFVFGMGFCFIAFSISYAMIFYARKKQLEGPKNTGGGNVLSLLPKNNDSSKSSDSKTTSSTAPKLGGWGGKAAGTSGGNAKSKFAKFKLRDKMKKAATKAKVTKMFSSSNKDPDFSLAVTYFIAACLMLFLWLPYFIIAFISVSDKSMWGGYRTIGAVIATASYCLKPVIYLAHNRSLRTVTTNTLPTKMVEKAKQVRDKVNDALDKIENIMFMSAATKKFRATIKTTIIAKRWLNKARANIRARNAKKAGQQVETDKINGRRTSFNQVNERSDKNVGVRRNSNAKYGDQKRSENRRNSNTNNVDQNSTVQRRNSNANYDYTGQPTYRAGNQTDGHDDVIGVDNSMPSNQSNDRFVVRFPNKPKRKRSLGATKRVAPIIVENDEDVFGTTANKPKKVPYTYTKRVNSDPEEHFEGRETTPVKITVLEKDPSTLTVSDDMNYDQSPPTIRHSPVQTGMKPRNFDIRHSPFQTDMKPRISDPVPSEPNVPEKKAKEGVESRLDQPEPINTDVQYRRASIITNQYAMPIIVNNSDGLTDVPSVTGPTRRRSQFNSLGDYHPSVAENAKRRNTIAEQPMNTNRHTFSAPLDEPPDKAFKGNNQPPFSDRVDYSKQREQPGNMPVFRLPLFAEQDDESGEGNRNNQVIDLPSQISKSQSKPMPLEYI